jgi:signal peptidase I
MARRGLRIGLPKKGSLLRELPLLIIVALVVSILVKAFLVQAFYIPSGSMQQTLEINDRVVVNKLGNFFGTVERGDIVVFRDPGGWLPAPFDDGEESIGRVIRGALVTVGLLPDPADQDLIKRVIGVGGDRVICCDDKGRITLNGNPLYEKAYLYPGNKPSEIEFDVTVPKGSIWVMGDHRAASEDSRYHQDDARQGMVPVDRVLGRAVWVVWPVNNLTRLTRPDTFKYLE